jgi:hypothetical protein
MPLSQRVPGAQMSAVSLERAAQGWPAPGFAVQTPSSASGGTAQYWLKGQTSG